MATKTIGQLTQATTIDNLDEFAIQSGGITKRIAASVVRGEIVNANIKSDAAIALTKLAALNSAQIVVGNGSNVPTAVAVTGDVTISNAGVTAIGADKVVTASILDANVTQAKLATNVATTGPAFRAHASATTSVSHNTATKVALATENFDTASCFASSTFTPNVAGYYQFSFAVRFEGPTGVQALLHLNGSIIAQGGFVAVANSYTSTGSDLVYMNGTTDYVDLYAYQASGVAQNVSTGSAATFLGGFLARAA